MASWNSASALASPLSERQSIKSQGRKNQHVVLESKQISVSESFVQEREETPTQE
jgi:hypothetical protein